MCRSYRVALLFLVGNDFRYFGTAQGVVWIGLRSDAFHFRNSNHRQEPNKKQEAGEEQSERADVSTNIDNGRPVISPVRRNEIAVEGDHDNDKALEPHAD